MPLKRMQLNTIILSGASNLVCMYAILLTLAVWYTCMHMIHIHNTPCTHVYTYTLHYVVCNTHTQLCYSQWWLVITDGQLFYSSNILCPWAGHDIKKVFFFFGMTVSASLSYLPDFLSCMFKVFFIKRPKARVCFISVKCCTWIIKHYLENRTLWSAITAQ